MATSKVAIALLLIVIPSSAFSQTLLGSLVCSDRSKSISIFSMGEGKPSIFVKEGQYLDTRAITSIEWNMVTLCKDGMCEYYRPGDGSGELVTTPREEEVSKQDNVITVSNGFRERIVTKELATILMQAASRMVYDDAGQLMGVELLEIDQGSLYEDFGLQNGDIITKLDDIPVTNLSNTVRQLKALTAAKKFSFTVLRNGEEKLFRVEVGP